MKDFKMTIELADSRIEAYSEEGELETTCYYVDIWLLAGNEWNLEEDLFFDNFLEAMQVVDTFCESNELTIGVKPVQG